VQIFGSKFVCIRLLHVRCTASDYVADFRLSHLCTCTLFVRLQMRPSHWPATSHSSQSHGATL